MRRTYDLLITIVQMHAPLLSYKRLVGAGPLNLVHMSNFLDTARIGIEKIFNILLSYSIQLSEFNVPAFLAALVEFFFFLSQEAA